MPSYVLNSTNTVQLPQFQPYTDQFGMMTINSSGDTTDNGNLFTAHYALGLVLNNLVTPEEKARINQVYANNFIQPGLSVRYPGSTDFESQDDMFGIMSVDAMFNPGRPMTNALYQYGKTSTTGVDPREPVVSTQRENFIAYWALKLLTFRDRWVWNPVTPGKFSIYAWLGRQMHLIATMQMALRTTPNLIFWLYWAITMLQLVVFPNKSNIDSYTLKVHSAIAVQGYGFFSNLICKAVKYAVKRDWGNFGNTLGAYFNNANHPVVALFSNVSL